MNNFKAFWIAVTIGVTVSALCLLTPSGNDLDFFQALYPAKNYLSGIVPWALDPSYPTYAPNPPTIVPLGLPFVGFPVGIAGMTFIGMSTFLLAYRILKTRPHLVVIFLSYPFFSAWISRQTSPFLLALALSDFAILGILIKPQTALPLALTLKSRRLAWAVVIGVIVWSVLSFGIDWPLKWLSQTGQYTGRPIFLTPLGIAALLLSVLAKNPTGVLYCVIPMRGVYDLLGLLSTSNSLRASIVFSVLSWVIILDMQNSRELIIGLYMAIQISSKMEISRSPLAR